MLKMSEITNEKLVQKFMAPGPYYTSYPVLGEWKGDVGEKEYIKALSVYDSQEGKKEMGLYIHFPYCPKQCYFCMCIVSLIPNDCCFPSNAA